MSNEHFINIQTPKENTSRNELLVDVPKMTLEWKGLTMAVKIKNSLTKEVEEKVILKTIDGKAEPGQLVVIMGPSGAGKSTLLDCISGRNRAYTGSVLVNGKPWTKDLVRQTSYVMQDDLFYATLTVKEHLMYQATLRMGRKFTLEQRERRVDYVLSELGLTKCRDTQIGDGLLRGLSGGERKRLSFATEILTNPSLLFVDEPTSGLDSFMAETVVQQLQQLAREGRTVIATIHQPSSELFALFDRLYLVSDGHCVYNGKASESVEYFKSIGYTCPSFMNPTDYYMRQMILLDRSEENVARVDHLVSSWKTHQGQKLTKDGGNRTAETNANSSSSVNSSTDDPYEETRLGAFGQMHVLCQRNVKRLVRDPLAFKARLGQNLFISIIIGLIYLKLDLTQKGIQSFTGVIFFIVVNQVFGAANPEFISVPLELPIMIREYNGGMYHTWVWYLAKNISELAFQAFFPLIFLLPLYFMVNFGAGKTEVFFTFYVILILVTSCATGLGYMVSCMARRAEIAPIIGVVLILPLLVFGGLFMNSSMTPDYFVWLEYISPIKYGFRAMMRVFWHSVPTIPCNAGEQCIATTGAQVLINSSLDNASLGVDVAALLAINVGFRLVGLLLLWLRIRRKD